MTRVKDVRGVMIRTTPGAMPWPVPSLIGVKIPQLARAISVAAFVLLGSMPALGILVDEPVAYALPQRLDPLSPGLDGCRAVGVTRDHDGTVWADEKCDDGYHYRKMN